MSRRESPISRPNLPPASQPDSIVLERALTKIGAKVVSRARYVAFQIAELSIAKNLFADVLRLIAELRPPPVASTA